MSQMGRPKLMNKEGHHSHSGYGRWHPVDQSHGNRTTLLHKELIPVKADIKENGSVATEIYDLVVELEKMQTGNMLISELQKSIETLVEQNKKKKRAVLEERMKKDLSRGVEQESLGGDGANEEREPNTYGLP